MSIREILLVPAKGYTDQEGRWNVGRVVGTMFEVDIIHALTESLIEGLDGESIPWSILETRKLPGVPYSERAGLVEPDTIVLQLGAGYSTHKNPTKNYSQLVTGTRPGNYSLSMLLQDVMHDWGKIVSFSHSAMAPAQDATDLVLNNPAKSAAFTLQPYQINGHDTGEYFRRLPILGRNLAQALKDWFKSEGITIGSHPVKIGPHKEHSWSEPDVHFVATYFESADDDTPCPVLRLPACAPASPGQGAAGSEDSVAGDPVPSVQAGDHDARPALFEDVEIVEPTALHPGQDDAKDIGGGRGAAPERKAKKAGKGNKGRSVP